MYMQLNSLHENPLLLKKPLKIMKKIKNKK